MGREDLTGKLLLEEPEGTEAGIESVPEETLEASFASAIRSAVARAYGDIDEIEGLLASLGAEMPHREDVASILGAIADDRAIHVGMLQQAADLLDGRGSLVDAGAEKALAIADGEGDEKEGE